jgi:hypothetical protein
LEYIPYTL